MASFSDKKIYFSLVIGTIFLLVLFWLVFLSLNSGSLITNEIYYIGRDSNWYPLDLRGKEQNMVGFSNELVQAIALEQGFQARVLEVGPNALLDGLDIDNYDAVLSSLTPNVMNRTKYGFSDPFYRMGPLLVVQARSKVQSLDDMAGKVVGIDRRTLQVLDISEPPDVVIIPYDNTAAALEHLAANVIDGVIAEALAAYVATEGYYSGKLKVATSPLTNEGLRLITRNEPRLLKLISRFNDGLQSVKDNGLYERLLKKWGLTNTEVKHGNNIP